MSTGSPQGVEETVSKLQDQFRRGEIPREEFESKMQELAEIQESADPPEGSAGGERFNSGWGSIAGRATGIVSRLRDSVRTPTVPDYSSLGAARTGTRRLHQSVSRTVRRVGHGSKVFLVNIMPPAVFASGSSLLAYTGLEPVIGRASLVATVMVFITLLVLGGRWIDETN